MEFGYKNLTFSRGRVIITYMKIIERHYLRELLAVLHTPDIKVITGVRRAGKSTLLQQLTEHIIHNIPQSNLIHINYNLHDFYHLRDHESAYAYISERLRPSLENYVLIDEVQMCDGFEWVINSLHASGRCHIVITGSNAFLEHTDLGTLFVGRIYSLQMYPFSFREYCRYFPRLYIDDAWDRYLRDGGFAGSYEYPNSEQKSTYVRDVFRTLIVRDIVGKYKIKDEAMLQQLIDFLADNIGNITSANKIANVLNASGVDTNHNTVNAYLDYLCRSFAFYRVRRYDIKGKDYLRSQDKYYLVDPSFRTARLGNRFPDYGLVFENIVAIELLRRGWELYVGVVSSKDLEIDFVARKADRELYIQVSDDISRDETLNRELSSLQAVKNNHPKIILARTRADAGTRDGIIIADLARTLANPHAFDELKL